MKPSRFSSFLFAVLMGYGVSTLFTPASAQVNNDNDTLPAQTETPTVPAPLSPAPPPNAPNGDGRNQLRSAYDRSSNPAYYDMLDRLERNQKRRGHHAQTAASRTGARTETPARHRLRTHKKARKHASRHHHGRTHSTVKNKKLHKAAQHSHKQTKIQPKKAHSKKTHHQHAKEKSQ